MATPAVQTRLTPKEYIAFERKALPDGEIIRYEYINGELIAMSGASRAHNLITGNIFGELRTQLTGNCHHCKNTSSLPKTKYLSNTTAAKRIRETHQLDGKTGLSPISKNLKKFYGTLVVRYPNALALGYKTAKNLTIL